MKIKDMEPQIEKLGLTMLEVKLNRKGEVRAFVCAIIYKKYDEWSFYNLDQDWCEAQLVVFDQHGHAYITYKEMVNTEGQFNVEYRTCREYKACFINKEEMMRRENMDLKDTDYELPQAEEAVYEEIPCGTEN